MSIFYLFHRRRLWNPADGTWMGWERKRGKLHEFNRLRRGDRHTSHMLALGDQALLPQIRYVITLDADTILPRGEAQRLIGTLAHPLNQAQLDPQSGRVVAGYTLLQPRTEVKPMCASQSLFTRVFAGDVGLICTAALFPISTRICSGPATIWAKASTQWTPLNAAWMDACRRGRPCGTSFHFHHRSIGEAYTIRTAGHAQVVRLAALLSQSDDSSVPVAKAHSWCDRLAICLSEAHAAAQILLDTFGYIAERADGFVAAMEFSFLFDPQREVFHIGYNIDTGRLDNSYYDYTFQNSTPCFFAVVPGQPRKACSIWRT